MFDYNFSLFALRNICLPRVHGNTVGNIKFMHIQFMFLRAYWD